MEMNKTKKRNRLVTIAFFNVMFIFLIIYFVARTIFVAYAQYDVLEKTLGVLFLLSEAFVLFHALGYFLNVLHTKEHPDKSPSIRLTDGPEVAVLIPARHEPRDVLAATIDACYNLEYKNKKIFLLDDSTKQEYKDQALELAKEYNLELFSRNERHGAKAGLINDALESSVTSKYVAIFDADQNPMPHFLSSLVSFLENDEKLAFVQTPQFYTNTDHNHVARVANMQQAVFFEYICDGKESWQSMMCCGTNVLLRRDAIVDVGGFDESTITEDFALSVKLQESGWKTKYYNHVGAFGMAPKNLKEYFKQQKRWAVGNVQVLRSLIKDFIFNRKKMKIIQWFEHFITGTYFFVGWAYLFLVLCPVLYLLFNVPSFFMAPQIYSLSFVPYFILAIGIFHKTMHQRHYRSVDLFQAQVLSILSMPVYLYAVVVGMSKHGKNFEITRKASVSTVAYKMLWPQIIFWAFNLSALTWGVLRFCYEMDGGVLLNCLWVLYHLVIFSYIFYFNENGNHVKV